MLRVGLERGVRDLRPLEHRADRLSDVAVAGDHDVVRRVLRLIAAGKEHKLAITAVMRKLVVGPGSSLAARGTEKCLTKNADAHPIGRLLGRVLCRPDAHLGDFVCRDLLHTGRAEYASSLVR